MCSDPGGFSLAYSDPISSKNIEIKFSYMYIVFLSNVRSENGTFWHMVTMLSYIDQIKFYLDAEDD